eukprot:Phypoly_transcript_01550.p1 GENE.Phypoly_transcript_01550~~Phypoly_transcript_01550.p1  ORF type:complete len:948 (+),score=159.21 Phypoly_transcript_01550:87-2930(+)
MLAKDDKDKDKGKPGFDHSVPFSALCKLFEKGTKAKKHGQKKEILQTFFSHYEDDNYFPVMRLLLPQLDKERQTYGMKETNLGKYYVQILNIAETSADAKRLLHWRKPTADTDSAGDFGNAVYLSLKSRCKDKGYLTVAQINKALDELNVALDRKDKAKVLKWLLKHTTAIEQKWLVRIILKELKIGLSEKTILNFFHENAMDLFNVTSNLRTVCEELKNPSFKVDSSEGVSLFRPIKPMLASRHKPEDVLNIMGTHPCIFETKFDGERIQVHKNGKEIKLFSRNSNDVTRIYGDKLIPNLLETIVVDKCIIDGELLVWDTISERFEAFGKLKSLANYMRDSGSTQNGANDVASNFGKQLCYMMFDLLFVKEKGVMDLSLQQRTTLLKRCVRPKSRLIEIVEQSPCTSVTDITNALDAAIMRGDEGIMIKDLESLYIPSERKEKWVKIKPEYVEGLGDDLDLLIIGGYYGKGDRRGGTISHFLLGVAVSSPDDNVKRLTPDPSHDSQPAMPLRDAQGHPTLFYSVCKVGTGYSDAELQNLQKMLEKHWRVYKPTSPPQCIQLMGFKDKPDVWIEPKHSKILQIKAAQILSSDKYSSNFVLRFPRVMKIRLDKDWHECMDLLALQTVAQEFEGRYAKRKYGDTALDTLKDAKKKRKTAIVKKARSVLGIFKDTDTANVQVSDALFEGKEFCVLNGDRKDLKKEDLEIAIVEHGGTKVQNPTFATMCALAVKESIKVQNLMQRGDVDIVNPKWLLACIAEKRIVPFEPKYMLFTTRETHAEMLRHMDKYSDSFTLDASEESLREVFAQIDRLFESPDSDTPALPSSDILEIESTRFGSKPWWGMFRNYNVYVDRYEVIGDPDTCMQYSSLELTQHMLEFYGATVSKTITQLTTHIVVDKTNLSRLSEIKSIVLRYLHMPPNLSKYVVSREWVEESVTQQEDLDEREFFV